MKEKVLETMKNLAREVTIGQLYGEIFGVKSSWLRDEKEIEELLWTLRELNHEGKLRLANFHYSGYAMGGNFYTSFELAEKS